MHDIDLLGATTTMTASSGGVGNLSMVKGSYRARSGVRRKPSAGNGFAFPDGTCADDGRPRTETACARK